MRFYGPYGRESYFKKLEWPTIFHLIGDKRMRTSNFEKYTKEIIHKFLSVVSHTSNIILYVS